MKKTIAILILLSAYITGLYIFMYHKNDIQNKKPETTAATEVSAFYEVSQPIFAEPTRIYSEKFEIASVVNPIGIEQNGSMSVPDSYSTSGWYRKSARAGEPGNMVINGHYDNQYGQPAAFWGLKKLKVNDKVFVVDVYGRIYTYKVVNSYLLGINDPDKLDILNSGGGSNLTLITCGGVWLPGESTYNKRLVVKAELVNQ